MKDKFWGLWIIAIVVLFGWQALASEYKDLYNLKATLASYAVAGQFNSVDNLMDLTGSTSGTNGDIVAAIETVQPSLKETGATMKRSLATAFGENDVRYHLKFASGNFVPTTLDFSTNILYNYSYLVNTPSKLIHNLKLDFTLGEAFWTGSQIDQIHGKIAIFTFVVWDILHAIVGIGAAIILLFIGPLIGLLFHPIHSFINFLPAVWQLVVTTWHGVSNLINLFK